MQRAWHLLEVIFPLYLYSCILPFELLDFELLGFVLASFNSTTLILFLHPLIQLLIHCHLYLHVLSLSSSGIALPAQAKHHPS